MLNKFDCNMSVNFLHICAVGHLVPSCRVLSVVTLKNCSGAVLARGGVAPCSSTSPWQISWSLCSPSQVSLHTRDTLQKMTLTLGHNRQLSQAARPQTNTCLYSILANLCPLILFQVRWCGRSWTDAGQRDGASARCHLQFQYI